MNLSTLLQLEADALSTYTHEIATNDGWTAEELEEAIIALQSSLSSVPPNHITSLNSLAIHTLISLLAGGYINIRTFQWAFSPVSQAITSEGDSIFRFEIDGGGFYYMILDHDQAVYLLGYLDDLEEEPSDRNYDYSIFSPRGLYTELTPESEAYLRSLGLVVEIHSTVIPPNSESLLVREDTSRFSSATWYQAIQEKVITLAGVGGIGSYIGFLLARMHPKSMFIYDDDVVESANMSGQLYSRSDIGIPKVEALTRMVDIYANYESMFAINGRFTESSEASDIMMCGFDNMEARRIFFNKWTLHVGGLPKEDRKKCLFIDGRLAAEELQIFAFTGDNDWAIREYNKHLFTDAEADETVCSYKQTTYMANLIGSLIVNIFVNFVANEVAGWDERDVPFFTSYEGPTMFFKTEK